MLHICTSNSLWKLAVGNGRLSEKLKCELRFVQHEERVVPVDEHQSQKGCLQLIRLLWDLVNHDSDHAAGLVASENGLGFSFRRREVEFSKERSGVYETRAPITKGMR